jgi:ParB family chromosome partitioning protein
LPGHRECGVISRRNLRIEMIAIDRITVVNPRSRGTAKFRDIVASIAKLGLKRPITVAQRGERNGKFQYDLVCGQGRLEAYKALGQVEVQAVVLDATKEELFLMSLTENLARRVRTSGELMQSIIALKNAGYSLSAIAAKTDLKVTYVKGIVRLLTKGEERLLRAVERGDIPISIAVTITSSDDAAVQRALTEAYANNTLRGNELLRARRVIEQRRALGKRIHSRVAVKHAAAESNKILETYEREAARERILIKRAKFFESRLLFVVSALRELLHDDKFVLLLREHSLDKLPRYLAEQVRAPRP